MSGDLPTPELRDAGEKLQQSIRLLQLRLVKYPATRIKMRALKVLGHAEKLFMQTSHVVMMTTSLTSFLEKAAGLTVDELFMMTGSERLARSATYASMAALNDAIRRTIDELATVNAALDDEEVKHGKQKD